MEDTLSAPERVLLREQLKDALKKVNSATLHVQEVLQDYRSGTIPSPDGDLAFRKALRAETGARRAYMSVVMAVHHKIKHSDIPAEGVVKDSGVE
jgi:hypothetical protein